MATQVYVKTEMLSAAQFMAQEVSGPLKALFEWLPNKNMDLFSDAEAAIQTASITTTAGNVLAIEITSPAAAANACWVHIYDSDPVASTLGTTLPLGVIHCPAAGRQVLPFFSFENSLPGKAYATNLWLASTVTNMSTISAAADRPTVRNIRTAN